MAAGVAVILAFLLNYCEITIFFKNHPQSSTAPILSTFLFSVTIFLLLWNIPLYPKRFRKLDTVSTTIIQFFVAVFLMEFAMAYFWFPLQEYLVQFLPRLGKLIIQSTDNDILCFCLCPIAEFFHSLAAFFMLSYLISIFFLLVCVHATRYLDLRILRCGWKPFLEHVNHRIKKDFHTLRKNMKIKKIHSSTSFCNVYASSSRDDVCSVASSRQRSRKCCSKRSRS